MGSKYIISSIQSNVKIKRIRELCPWKMVITIKMAWEYFLRTRDHPRVMVSGAGIAGLEAIRATLLPEIPQPGVILPSAAIF